MYLSLFPHSSLQSSVQSEEDRDSELSFGKYVFIFCLFSVVMAAVSEVSLCQVPVGLTPVFEADKHWDNTLRSFEGSLSHAHTGSDTCTREPSKHTANVISNTKYCRGGLA